MWLLYPFLIFIFILIYSPKFIYEYFHKKKYRGSLLKRLGFSTEKFRQGSPTIWVHAVSVGEIKGAATLIKQLKEKYPLSCIIVSSITQTGHEEAKKSASMADYHVFLPLDFHFIVSKVLKKLKINLVLLAETDIWPNFLKGCKKRGAKVILVNGKISEKSFKRLSLMPLFTSWYYSLIDFFLVQDEVFRNRFIDLNIAPEKIKIVPNLKLDDVYEELSEEEIETLRNKFDIKDISVVVGSTHEGEEKLILDQLVPLLDCYSHLKIFIVPRHPERFNEVEFIVKGYKVPYAKYSTESSFKSKKIILVDAMGQLRKLYQLSTLAIVAGSYNLKIGGHNILEPLWYSTPCLFGPHMFAQHQLVNLVLNAKAGRQVAIEDLQKTVHELLNDSFKLKQMGRRGKDIFIKASGGTVMTLAFIQKALEKNTVK